MKRTILVALIVLCSVPAYSAPVTKFYAGINGIWYDDPGALPSDFEAGANASASLSPHLALVGAVYYGFEHSYLRGSVGGRMTATDVNNPDFSVGFGIQRHLSSEPAIRPEEWAPDASVGWRPWPQSNPRVVLGAQGTYGLKSNQASFIAAVRYQIGGQGGYR